jgi:hypothetical protein
MAAFGNIVRAITAAKKKKSVGSSPVSGRAPAVAPTPDQGSPFAGLMGPQMNMGMFPTSGFANQGAQDYLQQVLGGGMGQPPQAPPMPEVPGMQGTDFASMIQRILGQFRGTPGPAPDPYTALSGLQGPLGNGGGYLTGKPFLPMPISSPKTPPLRVM